MTGRDSIVDDRTSGFINGLIGVAIFSGSLPATRVAVEAFDPLFLTMARAAIAGIVAAVLLLATRQALPPRRTLPSFILICGGVVVGFPLLTALALRSVSSAHAIVFIGLLPLATAIFAVIRNGERPRPAFWAFSLLGSALVGSFAISQSGSGNLEGDLLMVAAVILCGLGYAEGARLSRSLGGWQVISWALLLSLPVMLPLALAWQPSSLAGIAWPFWLSLGYVSLFSMLIGFVFWYRGLALGGATGVGQLQLLQPFMGLALAALLLGETVSPAMFLVAGGVVLCVAAARHYAKPA